VNVYGSRAFVYESAAILYANWWKKRSVVFIRGGSMPEFVQRWPRWTHFVFSKANLILVPHEFLRAELSALGLRVDGIIPNFIELEKYKFRERSRLAPRFLYLRGMHSIYNPAMAVRAFALIQQQYPDASLTMAGVRAPILICVEHWCVICMCAMCISSGKFLRSRSQR